MISKDTEDKNSSEGNLSNGENTYGPSSNKSISISPRNKNYPKPISSEDCDKNSDKTAEKKNNFYPFMARTTSKIVASDSFVSVMRTSNVHSVLCVTNVPEEFLDLISAEIMVDPITLCSGHTYDRDSIMTWVTKNGHVDPITKEQLITHPVNLKTNILLKKLIEDFIKGLTTDCLKKGEEIRTLVKLWINKRGIDY